MAWRGRRPLAVLLGTIQLLSACYQYVPIQTAPAVGSQVGLDINDEGRVALREQLGPGVARLEGRIAAIENGDMVVDASSVTQIRGRPVPVDSLRVRVSQGYVERMDERRLSRTRTWMVIGGALAIVAVFFATDGFGKGPGSDPPGDPPVDQSRVIP